MVSRGNMVFLKDKGLIPGLYLRTLWLQHYKTTLLIGQPELEEVPVPPSLWLHHDKTTLLICQPK